MCVCVSVQPDGASKLSLSRSSIHTIAKRGRHSIVEKEESAYRTGGLSTAPYDRVPHGHILYENMVRYSHM